MVRSNFPKFEMKLPVNTSSECILLIDHSVANDEIRWFVDFTYLNIKDVLSHCIDMKRLKHHVKQ